MVMINRLHAYLHRPEAGWDPVPPGYAATYAAGEWSHQDGAALDRVEGWLGGLAGKRVLDLGAGPGHYAVALARRGADVTWHDISRTYETISRQRSAEAGVSLRFSLGYLEDAVKFVPEPFDLVWNSICWNYCMDDRAFSTLVYDLIKPGGAAYIDANVTEFAQGGPWGQVTSRLNTIAWVKIGHPYPPRGRVASLFQRFPFERMIIDQSLPGNDRVFVQKPLAPRGVAR
jgi:SAM-dependent methyltransferase